MTKARVGILMGSDSDLGVMESCLDVLDDFGIAYECKVSSAHRTPADTAEYATTARDRGLEMIIIGAGAAAHLGGVVAAHTTLPVVGVPIDATSLQGVDALYSIVMMPGGIPVASMAIGKAGAKNAGLFAASVFSANDPKMATKLKAYREDMVAKVQKKNDALQEKLAKRNG